MLQNGTAGSTGASMGESTSSRFNRSWTDFTAKLGATAKPILAATPTSLTSTLLDGGRALQAYSKSRLSITPSKEQQSSNGTEVSPHSSASSGNSGATKDRTKSPSSTSETESKCAKNGTFGGKPAPSSASTSDLTGVLESNSTAISKQHHHSTSSTSSLSTLARMGTTTTTYTSQKPTAEVTTSTVITSATVASPTVKDAMQLSTKDIPSKLRTGTSIGTNGKQPVSTSNGNGPTKGTMVAAISKQPESSASCGKAGSEKASIGASGASDSGGKENSSSGNIISQEKLSIGNGNVQVETSSQQHHQQQQQQSQTKKFSKTPGRERKPNQSKKVTNGKGAGGTSTSYKGTALQFNTLAQQQHKSTTLGTILQNASVTVPVSSTGTVWGENCARFSDVVAQTPATSTKLGAAKQSMMSSMLLQGMEALPWLSGESAGSTSSADKSSNHVRSQAASNAYGTTPGSTQNYRKPPHAQQDLASNGSGSFSATNRTEQKSKDDSYIGGTLEKECSAPFVATSSASPDLGPIGTSKKSPTGGHNADGGEEEESDGMMGSVMAGRGGSNLAKCWEPFGGHVIHNPTQLASGSSSEPSTIGKPLNGGPQSDSFFSQSFADFPHRQSDQYRGIASMAGGSNGSMNGIAGTSSLLSIASHGYGGDHSIGLSNGGANQQTDTGGSGAIENDFMEAHRASYQHAHQQQHNRHDWNNTMESHMQWALSSHKPLTASQIVYPDSQQAYNILLQQRLQQQQQQQQQQSQQQLIRQLSSEEPNIISNGGSGGSGGSVSTSDPACGQTSAVTAVTASSTASTSGSSTGTSMGSPSASSSYNPFQLPSIWSPANNIDAWAAASTGSSEET
uniref:Uncharacterized protein n=1 Tax=Anopheles culicifacies TaxID=139723 RepID=A0A182LZX7_9DIPT